MEAIIPAVATIGGSLIGSKSSHKAASAITSASQPSAWQTQLESLLGPYLGLKLVGGATPYGGKLVGSMSPYESQGLGKLQNYLNSSLSPYYGMAGKELQNTLTGAYDPSTSPYYQAVRQAQMRELEDAKKRLGSDLSGSGLYYSGVRNAGLQDMEMQTVNSLNQLLGQMAEAERVRRLQAVPLAMQLGQTETNFPLAQAQAALQYGALPRVLEDAQLQAQYSEWLRQLGVNDDTVNQILNFIGRLQGTTNTATQAAIAAQSAGAKAASSGTGIANALTSILNSIPWSSLGGGSTGSTDTVFV